MNLTQVGAATVVKGEPLLSRSEMMQFLGPGGEQVLNSSGVRRYPIGATVYDAGDAADRIFLVARGEVAILSSAGADATPLATLHTGDCFGAGAALDPPTRMVTARAVGTVELVEIPAEPLRQLAGRKPTFESFLRQTHQRLVGAKNELDDFLDRW